jgi:hypothetical protein
MAPMNIPIKRSSDESAEVDTGYRFHSRIGKNDRHGNASYGLLGLGARKVFMLPPFQCFNSTLFQCQ